VNHYEVWVLPRVWKEINNLPGNMIDVLGVRKRPPYDYEDLDKLLKEVL